MASNTFKFVSESQRVAGGGDGEGPTDIVTLLSQAVALHQAGDIAAAEGSYRRVLDAVPDHPYGLHFLGVVLHQKGEHEEAAELIERALVALPQFADGYSNLGAAYHAMGRLKEAEGAFRRAAELKPTMAEAHSNLAAVLNEQGRKAETTEAYLRAHEAAPKEPRFMKRLGDFYLEAEKFQDAIHWFELFLEVGEDDGEVNNNLGYALERLSDSKSAERYYRRAIELCPDSPEINNNLASALNKLDRNEEANEYYQRAMAFDPDKWQDLSHLAGTFVNRRELDKALPIYEQLLEVRGDDSGILNDYGVALAIAGRSADAEGAFRRSIEANDEFADAYNNLGSALMHQNRYVEAIEELKRALDLSPRLLGPHINLCLALSYENRADEASIYAKATVMLEDFQPKHFSNAQKVFRGLCDYDALDELGNPWDNTEDSRTADYAANFLELLVLADNDENIAKLVSLANDWGAEQTARAVGSPLPPAPKIDKGGRIRVGIMSSDLYRHSVAKFVLPFLESYDHDRLEIFCYSPTERPNDAIQGRIKQLVSEFRVIKHGTDREFAAVIRNDSVDILLELNGFTRNTRNKSLAWRPAPVQIYWLGYPFTTGIKEIDYVILDSSVAPVNPEWSIEKPLLMPECWVCFGEFEDEHITPQPPVERNGFITFGSLNNPYKLTREVIALWSRVLNEVPDSRFLYVRPELDSVTLKSNLIKEFGRNGVGPERLFFVNNRAIGLTHFGYYDEIDITLDTFPLTGGTTTCDALWMGVPLITKYGPSWHQRLSYALMQPLDLQDLCVETDDDFVKQAVELANSPDALTFLRQNLRQSIRDSALGRTEDFAKNFENLLEEVADRHNLR